MERSLSFSINAGNGENSKVDEDGRPKRTGTMMTASAHIITAVIGSGVLSLGWATAQLGWVAGPIALAAFSIITWFTSVLLADCYRSPDPVTGTRNYTYMEVVRANLGGRRVQLCGLAQYGNMFGVTVGYSITTSISMAAIKRSNCFHKNQTHEGCHTDNNEFILLFGIIQIILSQIPNFHELSVLSFIAAIMSFGYSSIGLALCLRYLQLQFVQTDMEDSICDTNNNIGHGVPEFQRHCWTVRSSFFLALDCVLSNRDVHCTSQDSQLFLELDLDEGLELQLLDHNPCCSCWIHSRSYP